MEIYPLLPLRDLVVFPSMKVSLFVGRMPSITALEEARDQEQRILLLTQKDPQEDNPTAEGLYSVGTLAKILQLHRLQDGTVKVLVEGESRALVHQILFGTNLLRAQGQAVPDEDYLSPEIEPLINTARNLFERFVRFKEKFPPEILEALLRVTKPGLLADQIVQHINLRLPDRQGVLEILDALARLEKVLELLETEMEIMEVERRIKGRVKKQMERTQKEYYLQEQIKAIQKELGKKDDHKAEIEELKVKIRETGLSAEAKEKAEKELKRLEGMAPMSAEATVVRNYLDWLLSLPWNLRTRDKLDINRAEKILQQDHHGLEKPKERILEYLAVRRLVKKMTGPILCFVGPPGVGKTSLAKSIAKALNRKFVRISLGGVRDEAEIRGHRRTYIGSMPGRIIQYMKKAKSQNPVFLLDEIDKMSHDFRGDPAAALLEVLDPEQNNNFSDHYLEVSYDLSEVIFITTANVLYSIPAALQDRLEIIHLPGYTEEEKLKIAQGFLVPKLLRKHGFRKTQVSFSEGAIIGVIRQYTREAGVRNLERELAAVCRKLAKEVVREGKGGPFKIGRQSLQKYLGPPRYKKHQRDKEEVVGLATGLAWTEMGGDILLTEVTVMDGRGHLQLTGKLGEIMRESAQAALSYIRSRAEALGLKKGFYRNIDIHIHVPEGAIPKDGPSAGVTMATALASALTSQPVRGDLAMTGEITLRGRILPVGGIKEKVLAAHRAGIYNVIIPQENEGDLQDIALNIRKDLNFLLVKNMDEVLGAAMVKKTAPSAEVTTVPIEPTLHPPQEMPVLSH